MKIGWALTVWVGLHVAGLGVSWAGNWPGWRGPTGVGYTDQQGLPLTWDGKTGQIRWEQKRSTVTYCNTTPLLLEVKGKTQLIADGRIYLVSTGQSYVIKAGPRLEILGGGNLGGWGNGSSAAVSGGRIFVRDFEFVYCIGDRPKHSATE